MYNYAQNDICPCMNSFYLICMWMRDDVHYTCSCICKRKVIVCTKNETRVSAMRGHVCLYNILFFFI